MDNEIINYDSAKNIIRRDLESMSRKVYHHWVLPKTDP